MIIYTASEIGVRNTNEDNHTIILNSGNENKYYNSINMFGVYDGHGGSEISEFLKKELPKYFLNKKLSQKYPFSTDVINKIYNHLNNKLKTTYINQAIRAGSTCLVAIYKEIENRKFIQILNTGDSRAIICRNNIGIALTKDHKPNFPEERKRIDKINEDPTLKKKKKNIF